MRTGVKRLPSHSVNYSSYATFPYYFVTFISHAHNLSLLHTHTTSFLPLSSTLSAFVSDYLKGSLTGKVKVRVRVNNIY